MQWFKNRNTATKLMLGFGFMAVTIGVVGYQGVSGMNEINQLLNKMYEQDLKGVAAVKDLQYNIACVGRTARQALLARDSAELQNSAVATDQYLTAVNESLATAQGTFYTEAGKNKIREMAALLPQYQTIVKDIVRLSLSGDKAAALEALVKGREIGARLETAAAEASRTKDVAANEAYRESDATYERSRNLLVGIIALSVLAAGLFGYVISRIIARPLAQAVTVLEGVSGGDLTESLTVSTSDEVGRMAAALNSAVESMRSALIDVRGSSESVSDAAQQLASASEELSSGAQEQAASQEETSASLEELSSTIKQNADSARQANQLATGAREAAENGGSVVATAVGAMGEINASSKRIADIITTIDEIAFQTNLLALNAAVEAARAGEQGRGFAVVAAEVRKLAQRSATAAKEIKVLIQDSVRRVEIGTDLVNKSGQTLNEIIASVKRVTDIVGEISAASQEQATGIAQVAKAMTQMDQVTQQNSSQTEELASTAQSMAGHADQLKALVRRFTIDDNGRRKDRDAQTRQHGRNARSARISSRSLVNLAEHAGTSRVEEFVEY